MSRNSNAGKGKVYKQRSAASRKKKQAYDKRLNAKPAQIRKRVEANRARRKAKAAGKDLRGKDMGHQKDGSIRVEDRAKNRGKRGEGNRVRGKRK